MKLNYLVLFFSGMLAFASATYAQSDSDQSTAEQVKQQTQELLSSLKTYAVEKKDEAMAQSKTALENLDQRIDALEARIDENWDTMSEAAREQSRNTMQTLRKQRTKVAEWYGSMRVAGAEAWADVKQGFSNAYQSLSETWQESEQKVPAED